MTAEHDMDRLHAAFTNIAPPAPALWQHLVQWQPATAAALTLHLRALPDDWPRRLFDVGRADTALTLPPAAIGEQYPDQTPEIAPYDEIASPETCPACTEASGSCRWHEGFAAGHHDRVQAQIDAMKARPDMPLREYALWEAEVSEALDNGQTPPALPAAPPVPADTDLRDTVARALAEVTVGHKAFITVDVQAEYPRADAVLAVLPAPADRGAARYHLAWKNARRQAKALSAEVTRRAPLLGEYASEIERLRGELDGEREAARRLLGQRQEMAVERYAWQERGDRAEAVVKRLSADRAALYREAANAIVTENDRQMWATKPGKHWAADLLRRMADEAQQAEPAERPRCPHCQLPHDLESGSLPVAICESFQRQAVDEGHQAGPCAQHPTAPTFDDKCGGCTQYPADMIKAQPAEVVHGCPPDGSGLTPCCGRPPFELPLTDRISSEAPTTCPGATGTQQTGGQP